MPASATKEREGDESEWNAFKPAFAETNVAVARPGMKNVEEYRTSTGRSTAANKKFEPLKLKRNLGIRVVLIPR